MRHNWVDPRGILAIVGVVAVLGCQSGNAATDGSAPANAQAEVVVSDAKAKPQSPRVIGQGAVVDLAQERDPARTTVFDFTSEYCGPCRRIAPYLEKLHSGRPDVTVVKVDINRPNVRGIDWSSPTARAFGVQQVPHFKVMDAGGTLVAEGNAAWDLVVKWIMELEEPQGR
jgi:thiol-disulfide isomerase/thioredoxin